MLRLGYKFICIFLFFFSCKSQQDSQLVKTNVETTRPDSLAIIHRHSGRGALLLTRFTSLNELQSVTHMQYINASSASSLTLKSQVRISYVTGDKTIMSILTTGTSESDLLRARTGNLWDKIVVSLKCPYAVICRKNLLSIEYLGRRKPWLFGNGDIAFYDLAETMVFNIVPDELYSMPAEDLSGKGYLNTFNHVIAQAFMTSIFSEKFADFVADVHERNRLPELITGNFTTEQRTDLDNGPLDNYIDMINNECGQELGETLRKKYSINSRTEWTASLLADYLNDIQDYHSWVFQIRFIPFRDTDDLVVRFAKKINSVRDSVSR